MSIMSLARDKEKIWVQDEIQTHYLPDSAWVLWPLSYGETLGEQGHLLGSYVNLESAMSKVSCVW